MNTVIIHANKSGHIVTRSLGTTKKQEYVMLSSALVVLTNEMELEDIEEAVKELANLFKDD